MNFLAPGWIAAAAVAALGVLAIHLIAWRLPRAVKLPTARFVPDEPARLAARTLRPSDLALMALRVAIIMLGGLALARPTRALAPRGTAVVVAIERTGDSTSVRDSLRGIPDVDHVSYVVFDTAAQLLTGQAAALSATGTAGTARPSLSVGLVTAIREARRLTRDYERVSIVLASTFTRDAFDQATLPVRSTWPDSIRVVRLPVRPQVPIEAGTEVVSTKDDPVAAGIRLAEAHGLLRGVSRVVRAAATPGDSAFAAAGGALLLWPRLTTGSERVDGIHAGDATAIGHFIRMTPSDDTGRVIARWIDGTPAALESASGAGCIRRIEFDVPDVGDFVLTTSFQRLVAALAAPCGDVVRGPVAADSALAAIAARPASGASTRTPDDARAPNRIAAILMALAFALAIAEMAWRRRTRAGLAEQAA
jgi:aerotolerance regulator-like protein